MRSKHLFGLAPVALYIVGCLGSTTAVTLTALAHQQISSGAVVPIILNLIAAFGFGSLAMLVMSRRLPTWLKALTATFFYVIASRYVIASVLDIRHGHVSLDDPLMTASTVMVSVLVWILAVAGSRWSHKNLLTVEVAHASWIWCVETDEVEWCDNLRVEMMVPVEQRLTRAWVKDHLHPEDAGKQWPTASAAVDRSLPFAFDYRMLRADGRIIRHTGKATPISRDGRIEGYIGVLTLHAA